MSDPGAIYLSKLVFNPYAREIQGAIADCHRLHRIVMRGFPDVDSDAARKELDVLYRPELDARSGSFAALVQSVSAPDWSALAEPGGRALPLVLGEPKVKRIDPSLQRIGQGDRLRFRLRANPTKRLVPRDDTGELKRRPDGRPQPGARVPLISEQDLCDWLHRKAAAAGFEIESFTARPDRFGGHRQTGRKGEGTRITLDAIVFDGQCAVIDPDLFRQTVIAGIGSGKAYGFGLLSVGPAQ